MKSILTLMLVSCSLIASAQSWSVGAAAGTSVWDYVNEKKFQYQKSSVRGWDAEMQVRRETKGKWTYSLALNYGAYNTNHSTADRQYFLPPEHNYTNDQYRNQIISARIGANYSFFKNCKSAYPLMNKLSFDAGLFLAPAMGITELRAYYNDNGIEEYKSHKDDAGFGISAGMQMRVAYKLNKRLAATFTSATQFDFTNYLSIGTDVTGLGPDLRCSALLGFAYSLR